MYPLADTFTSAKLMIAHLRYGTALMALCVTIVSHAASFSPAVRDQCVRTSARQYYRSNYPISLSAFTDLVRAVLRQEAGCGGVVRTNNNKSMDVGCMQINSTHFSTLSRWGITPEAVRWNDCQNIMVGVWILDSEISRGSELWQSIGNYNSHTQKYNKKYQREVWTQLQKLWNERLAGR